GSTSPRPHVGCSSMPHRLLVACVFALCLIAPAAAHADLLPNTTITSYPGVPFTPGAGYPWPDTPARYVYWPDDAVISFESDQPGSTFECRSWSSDWYPCTSPVVRPTIGIGLGGEHLFVRAINQYGAIETTPAHAVWSIEPPDPIVPASETGIYKVGQQ